MTTSCTLYGWCVRFRVFGIASVLGLALVGSGCSKESNLSIAVDSYVNNAMQAGMGDQTGEPLDVDVVVLTPADLKREANRDLKTGSGITSDMWFKRHPSSGAGQRFEVPLSQIHRQTIRGREVSVSKQAAYNFPALKASAGKNPGSCVIYVFPRFQGKGGTDIPAPPAVYDNPQGDIKAFVGVDKTKLSTSPTYGQFIRRD